MSALSALEELVDNMESGPRDQPIQETLKDGTLVARFVCRESCCKFYNSNFQTREEWDRHVKWGPHKYGVALGDMLYEKKDEISAERMETEIRFVRMLTCNSAGCPGRGMHFEKPCHYYRHLQMPEHVNAKGVVTIYPQPHHQEPVNPDVSAETIAGLRTEFDGNYRCDLITCLQFGALYMTKEEHQAHVRGLIHQTGKRFPSTSLYLPHTHTVLPHEVLAARLSARLSEVEAQIAEIKAQQGAIMGRVHASEWLKSDIERQRRQDRQEEKKRNKPPRGRVRQLLSDRFEEAREQVRKGLR